MKTLISILAVLVLSISASADVMQDFDGLGDNKELFDKAKALHPDMNVTVVQKRVVDRRNRFEIAPEVSSYFGGDSYVDTYGYGLNAHFHITPRWSIGARYTYFTNKLNKEGKSLITDVDGNGQGIIPDVDYLKQNLMGVVNFYPIYGKMNMFGLGIAHFDVYASLGAGTVDLRSGSSAIYSGGGGVGFWWSQHFSTRFEVRYQTYKAQRFTGEEDMENTIIGLQMGYLL
ncbi:MAG: outer membrane beta-barrel domain-containing protein [Bdellovibrionaceae bacterium]|nr:outer membrane beta-barrel domain-containing protein [Pseudobdellovibrionaceae bacterium]